MEVNWYYLFTPLLALAGLVESAFLPHARIAGHQPDLMLTLVAAWSLQRGPREGILWALIGGMSLDLLSAAPFGVFTAALLCVSVVSSIGSANLFRSSTFLPLIAALLATPAYYAVTLALLYLGGQQIAWARAISGVMGPALLANTLCMILMFPLMRWVHRRTSPREVVL
jgi:rod shape-determining protein MreD